MEWNIYSKNQTAFNKRLRELRVTKGLSQKQVSTAIGMTDAGYQNYEVGRRLPTFDKLIALCDFFDVPADYLLGRTDEP